MFDTDKSETISRSELKAVFESNETKDDELWAEIFTEVDTDGDGSITFAEFKAAMDAVIAKNASSKYRVRSDTVDINQVKR